jgi:RNA-directed DNA polymerase
MEDEANEVLEQLRRWVGEAGLTLHPAKTRIVNASMKGGFDFLGYHFERGLRWPRQKSLDKFRETIRQKSGRLRPGSMDDIHTEINRTLRGWFEYFKHSIKNVFEKKRQMGSRAAAGHPAQTRQRPGNCAGQRPSTLAK